MKFKLLFILLIIPTLTNAQKSSYLKNRITLDVSYVRMQYKIVSEYKEKKNGVSLSANYGLTKFMESGFYYYKYNAAFNSLNFAGIQNRFHVLPFLIESNNRYFRLDAYVFNQTGLFFSKSNYHSSHTLNSDIGIGSTFYISRNIGINLEYKWGFLLSKHVENHNFQNGLKLGLNFKF
ncbi:MAG: hypothetical protein PHF99_12480 [Bacteroidales bacterium]|nr:hypothetical protein [Bacteroidales bacterium]MDD4236821.1 hypothetical protein [Bacteroidales bacterium]